MLNANSARLFCMWFWLSSGAPLIAETMLSCHGQHISIHGRKRWGHMYISGSGITWRDSVNFWRSLRRGVWTWREQSHPINYVAVTPITFNLFCQSIQLPHLKMTWVYVGARPEMNVGPVCKRTNRRWQERNCRVWNNLWICVLKPPSIFIYSN